VIAKAGKTTVDKTLVDFLEELVQQSKGGVQCEQSMHNEGAISLSSSGSGSADSWVEQCDRCDA
jgi:hypothetical protein